MATLAGGVEPGRRTVVPPRTFFRRLAVGISLFILFGFAQFAARGMVDIRAVPLVVHLHAVAMLAWLALFSVQAGLPSRGALRAHQTLGLTSLALVPVVVILAVATVLQMLPLGAFPPFFTPGYFLALVIVEALLFGALVGWAIVWRRRTDWHRRLMIGASVILLEPALGRTLPIPLLGDAAHWVEMLCQLLVVLLMAGFDRRRLGNVHPATFVSGGAVIGSHILVDLLDRVPAWQGLAVGIAAG